MTILNQNGNARIVGSENMCMFLIDWGCNQYRSYRYTVALPSGAIPLHLFLFSASLNQGIVKYITIANWSTDFAMLRENGRRTMLLNLVTWIIYLSLFPLEPHASIGQQSFKYGSVFVTVSASSVCFCFSFKTPRIKYDLSILVLFWYIVIIYCIKSAAPFYYNICIRAFGLKK